MKMPKSTGKHLYIKERGALGLCPALAIPYRDRALPSLVEAKTTPKPNGLSTAEASANVVKQGYPIAMLSGPCEGASPPSINS